LQHYFDSGVRAADALNTTVNLSNPLFPPLGIRERMFDGRVDPGLGRFEFTPAPAPFVAGWEEAP